MQKLRVAIDVMGGDFGCPVLVKGFLAARDRSPVPFDAYLCGNEDEIRRELHAAKVPEKEIGTSIIVEHCAETIDKKELSAPAIVWKTRPKSSIIRCVALQKEGTVGASVSAGDTGVLLGASIFILGRAPGVVRPALATVLPAASGRPVLLLDAGANINPKPQQLAAFGMLGFSYYKNVFDVAVPRVALLNIGKEDSKGPRAIAETAALLKRECSGYTGYIEGSGILLGEADVVVCDGFTGNAVLKTCESMHVLARNVFQRFSAEGSRMADMLGVLNPENYGGAPLLGINGDVVKAHGGSTTQAFSSAVLMAVTAARKVAHSDRQKSIYERLQTWWHNNNAHG